MEFPLEPSFTCAHDLREGRTHGGTDKKNAKHLSRHIQP